MTETVKIKALLLGAPDSSFDYSLKPLVQAWPNEPSALQILEVLDHAVACGLASGQMIWLLDHCMRKAIINESTTYEEVVSKAEWRKEAYA